MVFGGIRVTSVKYDPHISNIGKDREGFLRPYEAIDRFSLGVGAPAARRVRSVPDLTFAAYPVYTCKISSGDIKYLGRKAFGDAILNQLYSVVASMRCFVVSNDAGRVDFGGAGDVESVPIIGHQVVSLIGDVVHVPRFKASV